MCLAGSSLQCLLLPCMPIWATDSGERGRQGSQSSLMCAQVRKSLALVRGGSVLEGL